MRWFAEQRMSFITRFIEKHGFINRRDIISAFNISTPQASIDIREWMKLNPDTIKYNIQKKRYERLAK